MDEAAFQKKLSELVAQIETLPEGDRERLRELAAETKERHEQIKRSVRSLQESMDFLRVGIKYLLFDLEATRRENGQLKKMLESDQNGRGDAGEDPNSQ
jgi:chromosome segregation ATPase